MQVSHILPDPMDSRSVASLLRFGRGIDRQIVGNFMGKADSFNQEVMAEYVRTFPFDRLSFDSAFRSFADTFKQPPESQQVVRFTKNFVQAFLEAHNGDYRCASLWPEAPSRVCPPAIHRHCARRGFRTTKSLDDFMMVCLWHNSTWYNTNPKVPKMRDASQFRDTMSESISEHDSPDEAIFSEMYHSVCEAAFPQVRAHAASAQRSRRAHACKNACMGVHAGHERAFPRGHAAGAAVAAGAALLRGARAGGAVLALPRRAAPRHVLAVLGPAGARSGSAAGRGAPR
jgi:hypothetical protein